MHGRCDITRPVQLLIQPGLLHRRSVFSQVRLPFALSQRLNNYVRCQHPTLHCSVVALDLGVIHEPCITTNQQPTGKTQFGNRLQPALVDGAGTIGNALTTFQQGLDQRMQFPLLQLIKGA